MPSGTLSSQSPLHKSHLWYCCKSLTRVNHKICKYSYQLCSKDIGSAHRYKSASLSTQLTSMFSKRTRVFFLQRLLVGNQSLPSYRASIQIKCPKKCLMFGFQSKLLRCLFICLSQLNISKWDRYSNLLSSTCQSICFWQSVRQTQLEVTCFLMSSCQPFYHSSSETTLIPFSFWESSGNSTVI